ncbi:hypothetical protein [Okibacterium endophyticum]
MLVAAGTVLVLASGIAIGLLGWIVFGVILCVAGLVTLVSSIA